MRTIFFICYLTLTTIFACDKKAVFDQYASLDSPWHKDRPITYHFNVTDTLQTVDLFLKLRTNKNYEFSNLFLIASLRHPKGKLVRDTLEYRMANPDGSMLGQGSILIKEHRLWYKGYDVPFSFTEMGEYRLEVTHANRLLGDTEGKILLEGVEDVGFSIEAVQ
tara:strand:+ start:522 stop:1013 length:492 start_codon:yes stop_codon:yes gene_type:complete